MMNDTIAAVSSGMTESGIGIIRISGPDAYEIINRIFSGTNDTGIDRNKPNRVKHGFIQNVSRETLDEVLIINMNSPHSYTGEDTIEIDCHGGMLMMRRVLESVLRAGARLAEPGEFTKRAFLNGRIDLAQAEAVADVINSKTEEAADASVSQLKGRLSDEIRSIRSVILEKTAFIESAIDDPEHYSLDGFGEFLSEVISSASLQIDRLRDSFKTGKFIKNGIDTVLLGKPNAGKSSLLNALLGRERAIVTEIPGTTRDLITESISLGPVVLNISDTAGIRKTDDEIETIGITKALDEARIADLIICVLDSSNSLDEKDHEIISFVNDNNLNAIFVLNKTDISSVDFITDEIPGNNIVKISALLGDGIDELTSVIKEMFLKGDIKQNDEVVVTSLRHMDLLNKAYDSLQKVKESIESGMPEDFFSIDMMDAYTYLGHIIGEDVGEDLVNEIFSKFCMGK